MLPREHLEQIGACTTSEARVLVNCTGAHSEAIGEMPSRQSTTAVIASIRRSIIQESVLMKEAIVATTIIGLVAAQSFSGAVAQEISSPQILKPLQGISFDLGAKRAVAYFLSDKSECNLVVTIADPINWKAAGSFAAKRFEAVVPDGEATLFDSSEGKALEFACRSSATAMRITPITRVGFSSPN